LNFTKEKEMAEFRKLFLVLAAIAVFSVSGYADAFTCVGNPGANKALRGGGITELLGDVVLTCGDNNTPQAETTVTGSFTVQISNGANTITNRIGDLDTTVGGYPTTAAAEVKNQFGNVLQVVRGFLSADNQNIMLFPNVILPTNTVGVQVRFANIRVKADPVTSTSVPIQVYATVGTAQGNFPITNSLQSPGIIYPSLAFSVTDCAGGSAPSLAYQQCISEPRRGAGFLSFGIKFQENLTTAAFLNKRGGPSNPRPLTRGVEEGNLGLAIVGPESYTYNGTTFTNDPDISIVDTADYATRLVARFTHVPAGAKLYVTDHEIAGPSSTTAAAQLIVNADDDGSGGTVANSSSTTDVKCVDTFTVSGTTTTYTTLLDNSDDPLRLVQTESDAAGNYFAVFEVTENNRNLYEHLVFGVQVAYTADPGNNVPAVSTTSGTISGLYAPTSDYLVAGDSDYWVPRFLDNPVEAPSPFSIGPCVTNLLFPYVTTRDGYNTGIALVNTSKDNVSTGTADPEPFDTSAQTGTCTMYFFGQDSVDPVVTTPATGIVPGTLYKTVVSDLAPGFEGYIIARCNFQYAHGLAFILTNSGSGSQYLALVIPDRSGTTRLPDPFSSAPIGSGEQLGY
jgi:hypothetical protein